MVLDLLHAEVFRFSISYFVIFSAFGKNVILFDDDINSSGHVHNGKKDIDTQGLDDTTLTAEKKYAIRFSEQQNKFYLSLHYNGANSYLFVNSVEIFKFKVKDSEINAASLYLGKVSKRFSIDSMKKTRL